MTPTVDAIQSLRPGVEFVMHDEDVESIQWHTPDVEPLTRAEVDAEIVRLETEATAKAEADAQARDAAIAHAKSLGFTDEMIAVMYPALTS